MMAPDGGVVFKKPLVPDEIRDRKNKSKKRSKNSADVFDDVSNIPPKCYLGPIVSFVSRRLFIRNTKDSIAQDYDVPQVD